MRVRIKDKYAGIVVAGTMLVIALGLVVAVKLLLR
jgi:hypothetical protein